MRHLLLIALCLALLPAVSAHADGQVQQLLSNPAFVARLDAAAPVPTGDALFDRYAAAVWQTNAAAAYLGEGLQTAACLPDGELAGWEAEFGDDPRYWQLRYFCAQGLKSAAEPQPSMWEELYKPEPDATPADNALAAYSGPDPAGLLEAGVARGAYDVATLRELFLARLDAAKLDEPGSFSAPSELQPGAAELLLPLAQRLTTEFPEEADSWASLALVQFELGEDRAALAALAAGNAAASRRYITFFPCDVALREAQAGDAAANPYISGMILAGLLDYSAAVDGFIFKRHIRRLRDAALAGLDLRDWQTLHGFALLRAGRKDDPWATEAYRNLMATDALVHTLLVDFPEKLTREQRNAVWRYDHRHRFPITLAWREIIAAQTDHERQRFRYMFGDLIDESGGMLSPLQQLSLFTLAVFDPAGFNEKWLERDLGWGMYSSLFDSQAIEQGPLRDEFITAVQASAQWDWTLLDYRRTAEELEREKALQEFTDRLLKKELTQAEALEQMKMLEKDTN